MFRIKKIDWLSALYFDEESKVINTTKVELPFPYEFITYPGGFSKPSKNRFAVRCHLCNHVCTQYHDKKSFAKKEFLRRGHSIEMCKYWNSFK